MLLSFDNKNLSFLLSIGIILSFILESLENIVNILSLSFLDDDDIDNNDLCSLLLLTL
jgi:hypothetical protein